MEELPSSYQPQDVEPKWYDFWEKSDFFKANPKSKKPRYSIVMPPPNVTGILHMGHALVNTLQDILIRWKRMSGFETLWVPGTDHAGIATQTVVERHLIKTQGKRRKDFSREQFLSHIWKWKDENEDRILCQIRRLGCSCDWSRLRFTMDEGNNQAVKTAFKKLYDKGLIYRGDYLVNWDPVTQTALADDEVEYEEKLSSLWYFRYPIKDSCEFLVIATTRPETMLGDTAIAVSPKDNRYHHLIGKVAIQPLTKQELPILADHFVDPEFGTGVVKITPAHDPNDYQMGLNHNLPMISIMTPDGRINENGGSFSGYTMPEAREAIVNTMKEMSLFEKVEPHTHRVGVSYRSKAIIEPYLSKQWFLSLKKFAPLLREVVERDEVKLLPKSWKNTYFHWIDNLRDWCISRQLWWGHQIPVWYNKNDPSQMICDDGVGPNTDEWEQDEDVLDTWFSSALWPFSTMGWPNHTEELKQFYPNSVLITGHDILFFWVAKMILMGQLITEENPFSEVFLHGLIYGKSYWKLAENGGITYIGEKERREYDLGKFMPKEVQCKWEKMSKSKGNVIDPIEIANEYGSDALRMGLCTSSPEQREIDLDRRRFEEFKNFANKVWNGSRFVLMNLDLTGDEFCKGLNESLLRLEDRWILSVLNKTIKDVNTHLENYQFDHAATESYNFFWNKFCAYFVEISKPMLFGKAGTKEERKNKQKLLVIILLQAIRLMHPMAPFITEEIFQRLKSRLENLTNQEADPHTKEAILALNSLSCIVAPFPKMICENNKDSEVDATFDLIENLVYIIRNIRGEVKIAPGVKTDVHIIGDALKLDKIKQNSTIIKALIRIENLEVHEKKPSIGFCSTGVIGDLLVMIPLPEELKQKEKERLLKEKEKLQTHLERLHSQLSNKEFINKAPKQLIEKQKNQLNTSQTELKEVMAKLEVI